MNLPQFSKFPSVTILHYFLNMHLLLIGSTFLATTLALPTASPGDSVIQAREKNRGLGTGISLQTYTKGSCQGTRKDFTDITLGQNIPARVGSYRLSANLLPEYQLDFSTMADGTALKRDDSTKYCSKFLSSALLSEGTASGGKCYEIKTDRQAGITTAMCFNLWQH